MGRISKLCSTFNKILLLIQAILAEEFEEEEEEEEEDEETEEDATNRMRNDLEEVYDNDTNRLAEVQVTIN